MLLVPDELMNSQFVNIQNLKREEKAKPLINW